MKKIIFTMFVLTVLICISSPSFAQMRKDMAAMSGKLIAMDVNKNEVTIRDSSGHEKAFVVKKGVDLSLRIGNEVIVMYKIGTNTANFVKHKKTKR